MGNNTSSMGSSDQVLSTNKNPSANLDHSINQSQGQEKKRGKGLRISKTLGAFTYHISVSPEPATPRHPNAEHNMVIHVTPANELNCVARIKALLLPHKDLSAPILHWTLPEDPNFNDVRDALFGPNNQGKIRVELISHPICKGTGVWGHELEDGNLAFLSDMWVHEGWRKRGIARQLVELSIETGKQVLTNFQWVFMTPGYFEVDAEDLKSMADAGYPVKGARAYLANKKNQDEDMRRSCKGCPFNADFYSAKREADGTTAARAFWRSCGARQIGITEHFCIAVDPKHPSRSLSIQNEPVQVVESLSGYYCENPGKVHGLSSCENFKLSKFTKEYPLHAALLNADLEDTRFMQLLQVYLRQHGRTQMLETATKKVPTRFEEHAPLMHHVLEREFVESLRWLIKTFGSRIQNSRDLRGHTALEDARLEMEVRRYNQMYTKGSSEILSVGYVSCFLALEGNNAPTKEEIALWTSGKGMT